MTSQHDMLLELARQNQESPFMARARLTAQQRYDFDAQATMIWLDAIHWSLDQPLTETETATIAPQTGIDPDQVRIIHDLIRGGRSRAIQGGSNERA